MDLHKRLKARARDQQCTLTPKKITMVAGQLLSALQHLHGTCNVAHRDLKPENVIVKENQNILEDSASNCIIIKIADWDTACNQARTLKTSTFLGTLPFIAPELSTGNLYKICIKILQFYKIFYNFKKSSQSRFATKFELFECSCHLFMMLTIVVVDKKVYFEFLTKLIQVLLIYGV